MSGPHDITKLGLAVPVSAFLRREEDGSLGAEFVDANDPAAAMMAAEDAEALARDAHLVGPLVVESRHDRTEIPSLLMAYLFNDGPHPSHVLRRLYLLAAELTPDWLQMIPPGDLELIMASTPEAHLWRVGVLIRDTHIARRKPEKHEQEICAVLREAWTRRRKVFLQSEAPAESLTRLRDDETLVEFKARQELVTGLLAYFFLDGVAPQRAVRLVYVLAKAWFDQHLLRMTLDHLGRMFGEERATWSWRGKKKLNGFLAARGVSAVQAPYQKSAETCRKYAEAQIGNRNRVGGRRVAA